MPHFIKNINTSQGNINFYFNRIYTVENTRYHVSLHDKDRKALMFNMVEINGDWHFVNPNNCPEWLTKLQPQLSRVILDHFIKL